MTAQIRIQIGDGLFLRDPEATTLGKKILVAAIELIDSHGFEAFTFKKLAQAIASTEASIYRYFENKYQLLNYLLAWYWEWLVYRIDYETHNLTDAEERLKKAIELLSCPCGCEEAFAHIDLQALSRIVITESPRAYAHLREEQPQDVEKGFIQGYRLLCIKIGSFMQEMNPHLKNPLLLVSTLVETSHRQQLFAKYLPFLAELHGTAEAAGVNQFIEEMALALIRNPPLG